MVSNYYIIIDIEISLQYFTEIELHDLLCDKADLLSDKGDYDEGNSPVIEKS